MWAKAILTQKRQQALQGKQETCFDEIRRRRCTFIDATKICSSHRFLIPISEVFPILLTHHLTLPLVGRPFLYWTNPGIVRAPKSLENYALIWRTIGVPAVHAPCCKHFFSSHIYKAIGFQFQFSPENKVKCRMSLRIVISGEWFQNEKGMLFIQAS